jgi:hypothetical protein
MQMLDNNGNVATQDNSGFIPTFGVRYMFKMQVFSAGAAQAPTYRMKVWIASQAEPASWSLSFTGSASDPSSGCLAVVAQECDVNIGNITVVPTIAATRPSVGGNELLALYRFDEGKGDTLHDVSGNGAPLNLTISNPEATTWTAGGLRIDLPTIISSGVTAEKVVNALQTSNEIAVEEWLRPSIFTYSVPSRVMGFDDDSSTVLEVLHGLSADRSTLLIESSLHMTTSVKRPAAAGSHASTVNESELAHLILTRDNSGKTLLYINGIEQARWTVTGSFESWKNALLVLGGGKNAWLGEYNRVAIYSGALSPSEVSQNFKAGPNAGAAVSTSTEPLSDINVSALAIREIPKEFALYQNYPNPFNPTTTIRFDLPTDENVTLAVYNLLGQHVATLVDERRPAGSYEEQWDARSIPSGFYVYRIKAGDFIGTRKTILLK